MSQTYSFFHEVEGKRWIRPGLFGDEALTIASVYPRPRGKNYRSGSLSLPQAVKSPLNPNAQVAPRGVFMVKQVLIVGKKLP